MKTIKEHTKDENKIMANFYETSYNYSLTKLNNHINNKPLKIFKKKYKKWENEKNLLEKEINTAYDDLLDTYKSIEDSL